MIAGFLDSQGGEEREQAQGCNFISWLQKEKLQGETPSCCLKDGGGGTGSHMGYPPRPYPYWLSHASFYHTKHHRGVLVNPPSPL